MKAIAHSLGYRMITVILAMTSSLAFATPMLGVDGNFQYSGGTLTVTSGTVTNIQDLPSAYNALVGSDIAFALQFVSVTNTSGHLSAAFNSAGGITFSSGSDTLLSGSLSNVALLGNEGSDIGILNAGVDFTGGTLADMFGTNNPLSAIAINLSPVLSETIFSDPNGFSGHFNGNLQLQPVTTSVPEPGTTVLLAMGMVMLAVRRRTN